ncbi:MAG: ArnT family glycosyltransferase [Anaerolineae bacterium]
MNELTASAPYIYLPVALPHLTPNMARHPDHRSAWNGPFSEMNEGHTKRHLSRKTLLIILAVGAVWWGALLRLVLLEQIPPGLSHDEAYNGVTAVEVLLSGRREIFFDIYNGIEPLIIYWEALYFQLFGIAPYVMRLVNVTAGLLTIALTYALTRSLFTRQQSFSGEVIALLATWGISGAFWAVFISRLALRAVTLPLVELLAFYFLWRGLIAASTEGARRQMAFFALGGFWLGVGMYTYLSSRFLPFVPLMFFAYWAIRGHTTRRQWQGMAISMLVWGLVFAPLAYFYITHPDVFTRRSDQVLNLPYALAGDFQPLITSVTRTLGMFSLVGPDSSRYGLAGRPVLDPLGAVWLFVGLVTATMRLRQRDHRGAPYALLLIWWLVMLLPGFITGESPHYLRTVGALPPTFILWALGLVTSGKWLLKQIGKWKASQIEGVRILASASEHKWQLPGAFVVGIVLYLLFYVGLTCYDYFIRWASNTEARSIYGAEFREVAHYLRSVDLPGPVALSAAHFRDWDRFRLDLHMRHHPPFIVWFHGPQTMLFPPPGVEGTYIFTRGAPPHPRWLEHLRLETQGQDMETYRLRTPDIPLLEHTLHATFMEDHLLGATVPPQPVVALWGYELSGDARAGGALHLLLGWEALMDVPGDPDYAFYAHLVDRRGFVWAQVDTIGYDAVDWQPGVHALQWLNLSLPPDLPPLEYTLQVGLQERSTGRNLLLEGTMRTHALILQAIHTDIAATPPVLEKFPIPNACHIDFGELFTLRGYSISKRILHAGEATHVSLFWEVSDTPAGRYQLEVWLIAEHNESIILRKEEPLEGDYPTDLWRAGQWIRDRFDLTLPKTLSPGLYTVSIGWRDASGAWLPGIAPIGTNLGQLLLLESSGS